jgi:hypothetical protein
MLRFRPSLMITMAALLGASLLALGNGTGSELRCPLGITLIDGLIMSQLLTLYTTPVVYLYFDRLHAGGMREAAENREIPDWSERPRQKRHDCEFLLFESQSQGPAPPRSHRVPQAGPFEASDPLSSPHFRSLKR